MVQIDCNLIVPLYLALFFLSGIMQRWLSMASDEKARSVAHSFEEKVLKKNSEKTGQDQP